MEIFKFRMVGVLMIGLVLGMLMGKTVHAEEMVLKDKREIGALSRVLLREALVTADGSNLGISGVDINTADSSRVRRAPEADYDEEEEGPEGRTFHKIKRKLKPHKFGHHHHHHHGGLLGGPVGYYPGYGGYNPCRKLHGCGGGLGWQRPPYYGGGGGGPIASAFAGPSYGGYGGYGYGGGYNRPSAQAQSLSWNLGPFHASLGYSQAG